MIYPVKVGATVGNGTVTALGLPVQQLDQGPMLTPSNYASAFTPGQPNLLAGDAGISQIVDPLANQPAQVPVVTDIVQVQKTSPWVLAALGALAFFTFFKR